ncbi:hypothetical protein [Ramlibacter alkalitolerans]|uniref:Uncharacterized protein n=1 Tax=Ramlibacter alkalitolerans TaxID=2039631 RepID=A0ABS1JWT2_9BURK|nr:hypothetical protein [Ramlibacter alkalitolerans]MBL0428657.1 hypothetical protein [Ramlibacter alkalitolerans]
MKKLIVSIAAAGALAAGGAASAQGLEGVLPQVLTNILGNVGVGGTVGEGQVVGYPPGLPANSGMLPNGTVFRQDDGELVYMDPAGRQLRLSVPSNDSAVAGRYGRYGSYIDPYGRRVYYGADGRPAYVEQNGQVIGYGNSVARRNDRDGDGVANRVDRYPDDPRYR